MFSLRILDVVTNSGDDRGMRTRVGRSGRRSRERSSNEALTGASAMRSSSARAAGVFCCI